MHHEEHVREPGSEIHTINMMVTRGLGRIHVATFRTIEFHHRLPGDV